MIEPIEDTDNFTELNQADRLRDLLEARVDLLRVFNTEINQAQYSDNVSRHAVVKETPRLDDILQPDVRNRLIDWSGNSPMLKATRGKRITSREHIVDLAEAMLSAEFDEKQVASEPPAGFWRQNQTGDQKFSVQTGMHRAAANLLLGRNFRVEVLNSN